MSGRPVRLLTAATVAAAASLLSISAASASCYSSCGGVSYAAPVAYYTAPVVYSYSYAAPVSYAAPCANPCGYSSYGYASPRPMYVVNQGPTYTAPVIGEAERGYESGYRRAYPYIGDGGVRWHRRHWQRGYYPATGRVPRVGRYEIESRKIRPRPASFRRDWSIESEFRVPVTEYPPFDPPPVIVAPRERRR